MGKFAAIGFALGVGTAAVGTTAAIGATAAAITGIGAVALGGLTVAKLGKSVFGSTPGSSPAASSIGATPSAPSAEAAKAAGFELAKDQKRRSSKRVFTSRSDQANLLATPSTTQQSLLGG